MGKNLDQVYISRPSTTLPAGALIYSPLPPYALTDDSAIQYSDLEAQIINSSAAVFLPKAGGTLTGAVSNNHAYLFNQTTFTTTMSQTGIVATIAGLSSTTSAAYVVPATGSHFNITSYAGTTSVPTTVSQTITAGTACTLYYYPSPPIDSTGTGLTAPVLLFNNIQYLGLGGSSLSYIKLYGSTCAPGFAVSNNLPTIPANLSNQAASQSGTTVTGVGTSWNSTYVGHMIRYSTGQTAWITAFVSTTSLTVTPSQTVAATSFDIPGKTSVSEATSMDGTGNFGTNNAYINGNLNSLGAFNVSKRAVTATPDTVISTDQILLVNVAGAVTENIAAATGSGRILVIKDTSGAAATNNITITPATGTIDGSSTLVLNTNYGCYRICDGVSGNWSII